MELLKLQVNLLKFIKLKHLKKKWGKKKSTLVW